MSQATLPFAPLREWTPSAPPDLSRFTDITLDTEFASLDRRKDDLVGIALSTPLGQQYLPIRHRGGQNLDEAVVKRWFDHEVKHKRISNLHTKIDAHKLIAWGADLSSCFTLMAALVAVGVPYVVFAVAPPESVAGKVAAAFMVCGAVSVLAGALVMVWQAALAIPR